MSFLNSFSVSPGSNATQRVGYQSLIKGRFFQPRLNPAFSYFFAPLRGANILRFLVPDGGSLDADENRPKWR